MDSNYLIYTNIYEIWDTCLSGYRYFLESLEDGELEGINTHLKEDPIVISFDGMDVPVDSIDLDGNLWGRDPYTDNILQPISFYNDLDIYSMVEFHNELKSYIEGVYYLRDNTHIKRS